MTLDYTVDEKVKIDMKEYIKNILEHLPEGFEVTAVTPAANHLFDINVDSPILNKTTSELFHHVVAQLLFLAKRLRTGLLTGVAFLTTILRSFYVVSM